MRKEPVPPAVRMRLGGNSDSGRRPDLAAVEVHLVRGAAARARGPRPGPARSGGRRRRTCAPAGRAPRPRRARSVSTHTVAETGSTCRRSGPRQEGRGGCSSGRGMAPDWRTSLCPACIPAVGWKTRGMEFVLIAIVILVVALIAGLGLLVGRGRRTTRLDDDAVAGTTLTRPPAAARPRRHPPAPRPRASACRRCPTSSCRPPSPSRGWSSRRRRRRPGGWCGCAPGWPAPSPPSAAACSRCSPARSSPRTTGRRSRRPSWPPTSASPRPRRSSSGCAPSRWCSPPASGTDLRELLVRELVAVLGPDMDRTLGTDRHEGLPGRRPRRGRQRRRQDDDGRQDRPRARRRRQERRPRRRRHLPRRGGRPAGDLGRAGRAC